MEAEIEKVPSVNSIESLSSDEEDEICEENDDNTDCNCRNKPCHSNCDLKAKRKFELLVESMGFRYTENGKEYENREDRVDITCPSCNESYAYKPKTFTGNPRCKHCRWRPRGNTDACRSKAEKIVLGAIYREFPDITVDCNINLGCFGPLTKGRLTHDITFKIGNITTTIEVDGDHHFNQTQYSAKRNAGIRLRDVYKMRFILSKRNHRMIRIGQGLLNTKDKEKYLEELITAVKSETLGVIYIGGKIYVEMKKRFEKLKDKDEDFFIQEFKAINERIDDARDRTIEKVADDVSFIRSKVEKLPENTNETVSQSNSDIRKDHGNILIVITVFVVTNWMMQVSNFYGKFF